MRTIVKIQISNWHAALTVRLTKFLSKMVKAFLPLVNFGSLTTENIRSSMLSSEKNVWRL